MVLAVGQFIYRKGFDCLIKAAKKIPGDVGIYIVGGHETEEYHNLISEHNISNVHFVEFQSKENIADYYRAADVFALPTREDIWGLVVNEALAYGLPVVTTDRCGAGLELIKDGINGYIIHPDDVDQLAEKITLALNNRKRLTKNCLQSISNYSLENMAMRHIQVLNCQA